MAAQGGDDVSSEECAVGQGQAQVTVSVSVRWEAFFLSAIGFPGSEMTGEATAAPEAR
ncbi:hypothetical protein ACFQQB_32090 [Nonomuraea rubra]|uniref:hypothetical protein n=1 Tax=Nonomuraea rubra TaxID=46180 RepID=UPI003616DED7